MIFLRKFTYENNDRKRMVVFSGKFDALFIGIAVFSCMILYFSWFNKQQHTPSSSISSENSVKQLYIINQAKGGGQPINTVFLSKCAGIYDGKIDLVRMKQGVCTLVYSFINNDNVITYKLAQEKQYIFIGKAYGRTDRSATVSVLNIHSGDISILYDHTKIPKQTYDGEFSDNSINSFTIIGDALYVSIGGNFGSIGSLYYIPFSHPETLQKFADYMGGAYITQLGKSFVIHNGYGDTSWQDEYRLLNPQMKSGQEFLISGTGHLPGEVKLGDDGSSNFIVASVQKSGYQSGLSEELPLYTAISYLPLSNPSNRTIILPASLMPEYIADIQYVPQQHKIYLTGTAFYIFDIPTKTLSKIADLSTNSLIRYRISSITDTSVCLDQWGIYSDDSKKTSFDAIKKTLVASESQSSLSVDLSRKTVKKNASNSNCYSLTMPTPTINRTEPSIDIFKQLSLPIDYAILTQ